MALGGASNPGSGCCSAPHVDAPPRPEMSSFAEPGIASCAEPGMPRYEEVHVSGFGDFCGAVEQHQGKTIFAYFTGDKDAEGRSWCPDCMEAEPVVLGALKHIPENSVFIYCQVGDRPYWKDPNNDFRKKLHLTVVPTLLKYGTPQKLVESECLNASLVELLFSEDE